MRSKIFRQVVQINQGKADALPRFFGQADGVICKQAVRLALCGVALSLRALFYGSPGAIHIFPFAAHTIDKSAFKESIT